MPLNRDRSKQNTLASKIAKQNKHQKEPPYSVCHLIFAIRRVILFYMFFHA